jgi:hypothetical protein
MTTTNQPADDLNSVIVAAVNARVEVAVAEALAGDQFLATYIAAALNQEIEVKNRFDYKGTKTTFLKNSISEAIRGATERAVRSLIAEQSAEIEKLVATELRRQIPDIAKQLVGSVRDAAEKTYGLDVTLKYPGRDR